jgi:hypothetical protein
MSIHGWTPRGSLKNEWQKHTVDPEKLAMSMPQNEDHVSSRYLKFYCISTSGNIINNI